MITTAGGCERIARWLVSSSVVAAFMRLTKKRSKSGAMAPSPFPKVADYFAAIRCEGRNVDQPRDLGIHPCLGDHDSAPRVPYPNDRPLLHRQRAVGCGDVGGKRGEGKLDGRHMVALRLQDCDHLRPDQSIHEGAMHQNDVLDRRRRPYANRLSDTGQRHSGAGRS